MNFKKLFLMLTFLFVMGTTAFAQLLDTVYVDATQGNDLNNGQYPTLVSPLVGPVATIDHALTLLDDDGVIMIAAATAGTMDYGSPTITGKGSVTLKAYVPDHSPSFHVVSFNTLTINEASETIQILTDGTAYFETVGNLVLTAGNLDINTSANLQIASGSTLSIFNGDAALTDKAPQKGTDLNISYIGDANMTAGPEAAYGDLGAGVLTFSNSAGKVTFTGNVECGGIVSDDAGDAAINGNLTMGYSDIAVTGGGDLDIVGDVTFSVTDDAATANEIGRITVTGSDDVSISGTITWTADAADGGAIPAPITFDPSALSPGSLTLGNLVFVAPDDELGAAITTTITNANTAAEGALTIGTITAAENNDEFAFIIALDNSSDGKFTTAGGTIAGAVTNTEQGILAFSGVATVSGTVTNASTGEIEVNAAVTAEGDVTFAGAGPLDVNDNLTIKGTFSCGANAVPIDIASGKVIKLTSATAKTHDIEPATISGTGTLVLDGAGTKSFTNITGVNLSILSGSGAVDADAVTLTGTLEMAASFTIEEGSAVEEISLTGGTLTFGAAAVGASTLEITDFTQTGGTFAIENTAARTLEVNGNFSRTGGTFQVADAQLTVEFSGTSNQSFAPGTTMKVGNLNFDNPTRTITMAQSVSVDGNVTISQYTSVSMGQNNINLTGDDATFTNNGTYTATGGGGLMITGASTSTPTVAVGDANYINLRGTSPYGNIIISTSDGSDVFVDVEDVTFNGQITLNNGGLTLNNANADAGPNVILSGDAVKIIVNLAGTNTNIGVLTNSVFNSTDNLYDLQYNGTLPGDIVVVEGSEFVSGTVRDLNVNVDNNTNDFDLPNQDNVIKGNLTVGASAIAGMGAAGTLEVDKDGAVVSILGTLLDELIVSGATATVTGSTATAAEASVNNLTLSSTTKATVSLLKAITGAVETTTDAIVDFSVADQEDDPIAGQLILGGAEFNALSDLEVQGGVALNAGVLALGANDLDLTTGGVYASADGSSVTSTGGQIIISFAMNGTFDGVEIPYLTINGVAFEQQDDLTVSKKLHLDGAAAAITANLGTEAVNILDQFLTESTANPGIAGNLTLKGTTVTLAANLTVNDLTIDSDTTSIAAIHSDDEDSNPTARKITVTGNFVQTLGNVDQGINDIQLTGVTGDVFDRTTGTITQSSGALILDGDAASVAFDPGEGWSIKNLTIINATGTTVTNDEEAFTVTGTLTLTDGVFDTENAGELHLADGAIIVIVGDAATLNDVPTFDGLVNVTYKNTASASTAKELPEENDVLNNLTIDGAEVVLDAPVTVNGKLVLTAGNLDNSTEQVTVVPGGTIERNAGTISEPPAATAYILSYTGDINPEGDEFIDGEVAKVIVAKNKTWTLGESKTIGDLDLSAENAKADITTFTLTVQGNLNMAEGDIDVAGGALVLGGTTQQTFTVPSTGFTLSAPLTLDNEAGFLLSGGNLTMGDDIIFINGVLTTESNAVILDHTVNGMGFDHTGVADTNASHINGNVKIKLEAGDGASSTNGRFEFPTGSATMYRPYALTFNSTDPVINPTYVIVKHVDEDPEGIKNLPIKINDDLSIGSYPNYYWLVKTTPSSFSSNQVFDVEVTGTNIGIPYTSDQDLRMLKRQDGSSTSNGWSIEGGINAIYSNFQVVNTLEDTSATVRTAANIGGLTTSGVRFTIGVPTRAPIFTAPAVLADTMNEGATKTIQVTADPQDVSETVAYSLVGAPSWAAINATTGLLTLTPGFAVGSATAYEITIRATDTGGAMSELTLAILVVDANRAPAFTTAPTEGTIKYGSTLTLTYVAADEDADAVTYSVASVPAPSVAPTITAALGVVTFTPTFADAGDSFVFEVVAADGKGGADTVETVVTVQYAKEKGDVNLDGSITSADATPILKYVVGSATLTDEQQYYAKVNSDDQIGSLDAAWVLYYAVNGSFPSAKVAPAIASTEFGQLSKVAANSTEGLQVNNGEFTLPVSFKQTTGVVSVYAEFQLSGAIDFESVTPRLPEGWLYASSFENGVLKIAMAGVNPLSDGNIANINVKMMDKEATGTIQGFTKLNDNVVNNLNAIKVKEIPAQFALSQNYPNPFNPTTSIKFQLPENANVTLEIYNMLGQRVKSLINGQQESGYYTVNWDGTNDFGSRVASGIYIYRISAGKFVSTLKMNLLK